MIRPPPTSNQASFFHAGMRNQAVLAQAQNARQQWQTTLAQRASVQAAQAAQSAGAQRRADDASAHRQARPGMAVNQNVLAIENAPHVEKRTAADRQPFRSQPVAALPGQNRGVLHTGSIQNGSPSAPLARTAQRLPPVPRPIAFKRCSSCS